jgi:hypothetical protein
VTRRILAVVVVAFALIAAACSGDDEDGSTTSSTTAGGAGQPLRIDAMGAAVNAVEAALGGEQRFYEVNATPTLVNVFVASADGAAIAYVYDAVNDALNDPAPPEPASGNTFTWSQADFDPGKVMSEALGELPNALPRTFAVTAATADAVQYLVTLESTQGGVLDVLVDRDGTVLGAQAR